MEYLENFKKLINSNIPYKNIGNKMSVTFTEKEVEQLEDAICNSTSMRSYSSHKKDMKKFILAYFEKQRTAESKKKSDNIGKSHISEKKNSKKKNSKKKNSKKKIKSDEKKSPKDPKGPKDGYKILKVSKNYEFPSSIYKKDDPDVAAKSAMKGIIRKNELDDDTFTFSIITGEYTYKYTCKSGKLITH
jgi:hypothetical protein